RPDCIKHNPPPATYPVAPVGLFQPCSHARQWSVPELFEAAAFKRYSALKRAGRPKSRAVAAR
ncbi:MAG: hypothetical protein ABF491_11680, partial [Acetobacter sp.]|uniref:hypothetical protein n=1 Tax=Acetobacter sp. TaxID=440 RepID=UPI0039E9C601